MRASLCFCGRVCLHGARSGRFLILHIASTRGWCARPCSHLTSSPLPLTGTCEGLRPHLRARFLTLYSRCGRRLTLHITCMVRVDDARTFALINIPLASHPARRPPFFRPHLSRISPVKVMVMKECATPQRTPLHSRLPFHASPSTPPHPRPPIPTCRSSRLGRVSALSTSSTALRHCHTAHCQTTTPIDTSLCYHTFTPAGSSGRSGWVSALPAWVGGARRGRRGATRPTLLIAPTERGAVRS